MTLRKVGKLEFATLALVACGKVFACNSTGLALLALSPEAPTGAELVRVHWTDGKSEALLAEVLPANFKVRQILPPTNHNVLAIVEHLENGVPQVVIAKVAAKSTRNLLINEATMLKTLKEYVTANALDDTQGPKGADDADLARFFVFPLPASRPEEGYLIFPKISGRALHELLPYGLTKLEQDRIQFQFSTALDVVHRAGIVHADIKPGNVLVDDHGNLKIIDFGIARKVGQEYLVEGTLPFVPHGQKLGAQAKLKHGMEARLIMARLIHERSPRVVSHRGFWRLAQELGLSLSEFEHADGFNWRAFYLAVRKGFSHREIPPHLRRAVGELDETWLYLLDPDARGILDGGVMNSPVEEMLTPQPPTSPFQK